MLSKRWQHSNHIPDKSLCSDLDPKCSLLLRLYLSSSILQGHWELNVPFVRTHLNYYNAPAPHFGLRSTIHRGWASCCSKPTKLAFFPLILHLSLIHVSPESCWCCTQLDHQPPNSSVKTSILFFLSLENVHTHTHTPLEMPYLKISRWGHTAHMLWVKLCMLEFRLMASLGWRDACS